MRKRDAVDWIGRIHIGRWKDKTVWRDAVEKQAVKWLRCTPQIENATDDVMMWQRAGLLIGVDEKCESDIRADLSRKLSQVKENMVNPEHLLMAYALRVCSENVESFVEEYRKSTIPYRRHELLNRYVDTIGMVVPYLHWTGREDMAIRQLEEYDNAMWRGVFPAHAYNTELNLPMGVFDWCRGCGWYILALVESRDMGGVRDRVVNLASALLPLQKDDGGYGAFLFNKKTRNESSGTALIGLLMAAAYEYTKDGVYLISARNCRNALMAATRRNGCVDFCQGDTACIGDYSHTFSLMPFVQGMALKLCRVLDKYDSVVLSI